MNRYVFRTTAVNVLEKTRIVEVEKDKDPVRQSVGWFCFVSPEASIFVGIEKPDIKAGDEIEITIRRLKDD